MFLWTGQLLFSEKICWKIVDRKTKLLRPSIGRTFRYIQNWWEYQWKAPKNHVSSKNSSGQLESSVNDPAKKISVKSKSSAGSQQKMRKVESVFKAIFSLIVDNPAKSFQAKSMESFHLKPRKYEKTEESQKQIVKQFNRTRKMQFHNHCSHFGRKIAKTYGPKVENDERRKFSQKSSFSSKLSSRHLDCGIDKPTERFSISVWKFLLKARICCESCSFWKNCFARESSIWSRNRQFWQYCRSLFAPFFKNFLPKFQKY